MGSRCISRIWSSSKLNFFLFYYFTKSLLYLDTYGHCHSNLEPQQRQKKGSSRVRRVSNPSRFFFFLLFILDEQLQGSRGSRRISSPGYVFILKIFISLFHFFFYCIMVDSSPRDPRQHHVSCNTQRRGPGTCSRAWCISFFITTYCTENKL
jgi:hypothetical protein